MCLIQQLLVTLKKVIKACTNFEFLGLDRLTGPETTKLLLPPMQEIQEELNRLDVIYEDLCTIHQETQIFKDHVSNMTQATFQRVPF